MLIRQRRAVCEAAALGPATLPLRPMPTRRNLFLGLRTPLARATRPAGRPRGGRERRRPPGAAASALAFGRGRAEEVERSRTRSCLAQSGGWTGERPYTRPRGSRAARVGAASSFGQLVHRRPSGGGLPAASSCRHPARRAWLSRMIKRAISSFWAARCTPCRHRAHRPSWHLCTRAAQRPRRGLSSVPARNSFRHFTHLLASLRRYCTTHPRPSCCSRCSRRRT